MKTILLVDSDITNDSAFTAALGKFDSSWNIRTVSSGAAALSYMDKEHVDAIVSDTILPDMSGHDLLVNVRSLAPRVIRFALSADLDSETVMEYSRACQRFLAKPVSATYLATTLSCSLRLRSVMENPHLQDYMSGVKSVPAMPAIYDEMMKELSMPNSSLARVAGIIETDTGLTLSILKIVNSAFYGLSRRVDSVNQAVTLLGAHLIKNITLTAKVFARFEGSTLSIRRLTELNNQAMKLGAMCNQFSRFAKLPKTTVDHCQIVGMMANVGELIETTQRENNAEFSDMGSEVLGASLLQSWQMSDAIVEAIALQRESPVQDCERISPHVVLHSIRYLQDSFLDTTDTEQRDQAKEYLSAYIPESTVELWLNAFAAIQQLTADQMLHAA